MFPPPAVFVGGEASIDGGKPGGTPSSLTKAENGFSLELPKGSPHCSEHHEVYAFGQPKLIVRRCSDPIVVWRILPQGHDSESVYVFECAVYNHYWIL